MNAADTIREAAKVLRERVVATAPAPWFEPEGGIYGEVIAESHPNRQADRGYGGVLIGESMQAAERAYVTTVHPGVALALADWLEQAASIIREAGDGPYAILGTALSEHALAVARQILGGDQ